MFEDGEGEMKQLWRTLPGAGRVLVLVCLSVVLVGCGNSPELAVSGFFTALNNEKPSEALDYVCESFILPPLPPKGFLHDLHCQTIDNDGNLAHVNVKASVRFNVGPVEIKKNLDFAAVAHNQQGEWCISRDSLVEALKSLIDITK
jgi:hypothetical protein